MDFKRLLHRQGPQPKEQLDMARDFFIKKYFNSQEHQLSVHIQQNDIQFISTVGIVVFVKDYEHFRMGSIPYRVKAVLFTC